MRDDRLKLVLDTHAALWWVEHDRRLSEQAVEAVRDPTNHVFLSSVVVWEVAVKQTLGKLAAPANFVDVLVASGARPLPVTIEHAVAVRDLPLHHGDPFDRMLVAQALVEGAAIVSADPRLRAYDARVEW